MLYCGCWPFTTVILIVSLTVQSGVTRVAMYVYVPVVRPDTSGEGQS